MRMLLRATGLLLSALALGGPSYALASGLQDGRGGGLVAAPAPAGFVAFCAKNPGECAGDLADEDDSEALSAYWSKVFGGRDISPGLIAAPETLGAARGGSPVVRSEARPIAMSAAQRRALIRTNRKINGQIRGRSDLETYGRSDVWALPIAEGLGVGDCEDYVLEKRRALRDAGVPESALAIAIVATRSELIHAVLLIHTDEGLLVMDNLEPGLATIERSPYTIVMRQRFGAPNRWVAPT